MLAFCVSLCSAPVWSQDGSDSEYRLNGMGEFKEFNKPIMLLKLELENQLSDELGVIALDGSKKLSIRILEPRSLRNWGRIWLQNLSINNPPDIISAQTEDLIEMTSAFGGSLEAGDLIVYERISANETQLSVNDALLGSYETDGFFEFLLSAFIGPIPPSNNLKAKLLSAGTDLNQDLIQQFDGLSFSEERQQAVASWNAEDEPAAPEPEVAAEPVSEPEPAPEVAEADIQDEGNQFVTLTDSPPVAEEAINLVEDSQPIDEPEIIDASTDPVFTEPATASIAEEPEEEPLDSLLFTAEELLATQNYQRSALQKIYGEVRYPTREARLNREGSLRVQVAIARDGSVASAQITENAPSERFDDAVIDAVNDAAPFDRVPDSIRETPMVLEIPVSFRLQ